MTSEEQAIETAYQAQVQKLFAAMIGNLVNGESEDSCLENFKTGMAIAHRARQLAAKCE